jgi:hypothetical protein
MSTTQALDRFLDFTKGWTRETALSTHGIAFTAGKWSYYMDMWRERHFKTGDRAVVIKDGILVEDRRSWEQVGVDEDAYDARPQADRETDEAQWDEHVAAIRFKNSWRDLFHTKAELLNAPPLTFAIERFLQEDGVNMIGGLSGHGKTLIALAITKALLEGGELFDYFAVNRPARRVIYLCPESALGPFKDRLDKFRLLDHYGKKLFARTLNAGQNIKLTDPLLRYAVDGADVFLDTATRFMEGDENAAADQRVFAENLFALLRAGARTVTGLHHSSKAFSGASDITLENVLRGSGDLGAMLATCWGIVQTDAATTRIHVKCVKARDFKPDGEFEIEGRPHIDETGKFKLVSQPGLTVSIASKKQSERGRKGAQARKIYLTAAEMKAVREELAKGRTQESVAKDFGMSARTLARNLEQIAQLGKGSDKLFAASAAESAGVGKPSA